MARENWGQELWADLNPTNLSDGIEEFILEFRRLLKWIRLLKVGEALNLEMKNFKNSLPLIASLKDDAFTERHWKMLMQHTGIVFDIHQGDLTLNNIFAMNLHKIQVNDLFTKLRRPSKTKF